MTKTRQIITIEAFSNIKTTNKLQVNISFILLYSLPPLSCHDLLTCFYDLLKSPLLFFLEFFSRIERNSGIPNHVVFFGRVSSIQGFGS